MLGPSAAGKTVSTRVNMHLYFRQADLLRMYHLRQVFGSTSLPDVLSLGQKSRQKQKKTKKTKRNSNLTIRLSQTSLYLVLFVCQEKMFEGTPILWGPQFWMPSYDQLISMSFDELYQFAEQNISPKRLMNLRTHDVSKQVTHTSLVERLDEGLDTAFVTIDGGNFRDMSPVWQTMKHFVVEDPSTWSFSNNNVCGMKGGVFCFVCLFFFFLCCMFGLSQSELSLVLVNTTTTTTTTTPQKHPKTKNKNRFNEPVCRPPQKLEEKNVPENR